MKRAQNIEKHFAEYLRKIASLETSASIFDKMFKTEWHRLSELNENQIKSEHDFAFSIHNFSFQTIDNQFISYDLKKFNVDESKLNLVDVWNRHYQILLVQAFEAFVEFLKKIYDELSDLDSELPKLIHPSERTVKNIRKELFKKFPSLEVYDTKNQLKTNFKFTLPFIEKLRHLIAHSHGEFKNFEEFKKKVLDVNSLFHNGNYDPEFEDYFQTFTRQKGDQLEVILTPSPKKQDSALNSWLPRFELLNRDLMAYSELVQRVSIQEIRKIMPDTK